VSNSIEHRVQELSRSIGMLALIGASLKLRSCPSVDPAVRKQIDLGARIALGADPAAINEQQAPQLLTVIEMTFAEAGELLRHSERGAGWQVADLELLQTQGRASKSVFTRILSLAETRPLLREALNGTFLDVGTGVAGIALEAARTCPNLQVDGIDIWEPALALAKKNVLESPYADRVHIMNLDIAALAVEHRYSLVWLPTMFLNRPVLEQAIDRIIVASRRGAYLIAALYTEPKDSFAAVLSTLRTTRSGGEVTDPSELQDMLKSRGYADLEVNVTPIATFILGKRP
jgi:precorrin-6B methylase 2